MTCRLTALPRARVGKLSPNRVQVEPLMPVLGMHGTGSRNSAVT